MASDLQPAAVMEGEVRKEEETGKTQGMRNTVRVLVIVLTRSPKNPLSLHNCINTHCGCRNHGGR
jgi:hypothetical protein